jgi:miniconductance mechanosensitive channel
MNPDSSSVGEVIQKTAGLANTFEKWLLGHGVSESLAGPVGWILLALAVAILAIIANLIGKRILLSAVTFFVRRSPTQWDDALLERKVFTRLSHVAPALVIYSCAPLFPSIEATIQRLSLVYMIVVGLLSANAFMGAVADIYRTFEISRTRPIKGYIQVMQIFLAIFVVIICLSLLLNRSPWIFLSGFGAMTAIVLLLFKDSILGFVAGIQLTQNDMVHIGDWIEMPKFGADGPVIDVSLTTVKVQNWDKTVTTIPTYSLVADSFKNWRGMDESGGRRIKRSINLDMRSVKFVTEEMLGRFERFQLLAGYIQSKKKEIGVYNEQHEVDTSELINGRNMTNVGCFRAYVVAYLRQHPKIHQQMTFLVRQLQPTQHGLPLEIYVFSNDQVWANYEAIQADIFDHILAVVPMFDLRVYQSPTGHDLLELGVLSAGTARG